MNIEEFMNQCFSRGYAYKKERKQVQEWCKKYPKDEYTEDDFIELYRYLNTQNIGNCEPSGKWKSMTGGHKAARHHHDWRDDDWEE